MFELFTNCNADHDNGLPGGIKGMCLSVFKVLTGLPLFSLTVTFSATMAITHCTNDIFVPLSIHTQKFFFSNLLFTYRYIDNIFSEQNSFSIYLHLRRSHSVFRDYSIH